MSKIDNIKDPKMDGRSLNPKDILMEKLKELIPGAFTEKKVDWEKLKIALGEDIEFRDERYHLNWAGKSEVFRVLQTPTVKTLIPAKEESVDFDQTENLFIEGENLEVLKALQKSYFGKVKMIYIDPPYNTGNDSFIYPDKFSESKEEYLKRIGSKDDEGFITKEGLFRKNSRENGQYHSNWLSMIYPRLFLSRNLLRDDGVIFVSIDDNEVHNLRMVMNEIFGEENFVASIIWKRRSSSALSENLISTDHEYVLCYQKNIQFIFNGINKDYSAYSNPDNDTRGEWVLGDLTVGMTKDQRPNQFYDLVNPKTNIIYKANPDRVWAYIPESMNKLLNENRIFFPKDNNKRPMIKRFKNELKTDMNPISTWFDEVGMNSEGTKDIRDIFLGTFFSYSKPLSLLKSLIKYSIPKDDIILDFFAGSATTAHAVLDLNREDGGRRKFICVQLPEPCDEKSEAYKAGYKTIADIAKERIRRVIKKIKSEEKDSLDFKEGKGDTGFKVFKLADSNFKLWRANDIKSPEELEKQLDIFIDPVAGEATPENMFYELLLKSGFELASKVLHKDKIFIVNGGELAMLLEKADDALIKKVIGLKPRKVIALDRLFRGNDRLKTNTALQFKDAGVEFKAV